VVKQTNAKQNAASKQNVDFTISLNWELEPKSQQYQHSLKSMRY